MTLRAAERVRPVATVDSTIMSESPERRHGNPETGGAIRWCMFLALFFLITWIWIEPSVIYYAHGWMMRYVIYVPGMHTFEDTPYLPGAVAKWAAGLLSHYYYYSAVGAAIITIVAGLLCLGADRLIAAVGGARWLRWLAFAPAFAMIVQYGRYTHLLSANLSLLLAVSLLCVYTRLPSRRSVLPFVAFAVLAAVMYLTAVLGFLAFAVPAVLFDAFVRRRWRLGIANLIVAAVLPPVASVVFIDLPVTRAYLLVTKACLSVLPGTLDNNPTKHMVLFGLLLILPIAGLSRLAGRKLRPVKPTSPNRSTNPRRLIRSNSLLATLILLLVFAAVAQLSIITGPHHAMRLNRLVRCRMWVQALDEARKIPESHFTPTVRSDVNRALYYTGRLGDEMFTFSQAPAESLSYARPSTYRRAELLYELGHVNGAEHLTHELLEVDQYNPTALQRLAMINAIKHLPDASRIFSQALTKDFIYRDWAREHLAKLEADPRLAADQHIQHMRSLMPIESTTARPIFFRMVQHVLLELSKRNKGNRMAIEYLIATHLRDGQLEVFDQYLAGLNSLDKPPDSIPRHHEEAILLHVAMTGRNADLAERHISDQSRARFEQFKLRLGSLRPSDDAADVLKEEFGDTYYYYDAFQLDRCEAIVTRLAQ